MSAYNKTSRKIMKVALTLFAEQGYYATTTKQIAQEAGVNELTIFRHFGSKAQLFQVTTAEYVEETHVENILLDGLECRSVEESIALLIQRIYKLYVHNTKLYKVQLKLADNEGEFVKLKLSRKTKQIIEVFFEDLCKKHMLKGDVEVMATMLISGLLGIFTVDILTEYHFSQLTDAQKIEAFTQLFLACYAVK